MINLKTLTNFYCLIIAGTCISSCVSTSKQVKNLARELSSIPADNLSTTSISHDELNRNIFFGFYGAAGWGLNFTSILAPYTNITWIREMDDSKTGDFRAPMAIDTIKVLNEIKSNYPDLKAIVDISPIFFNPDTFLLYPDYLSRWQTYLSNIAQAGNFTSQLGAIYTQDEAYSNGLAAKPNQVPASIMFKQLETVSSVVRFSFPTTPLALSYSIATFYKALDSFPIPPGYDLIGVDCYGNWTSCVYPGGKASMPEVLTYLENNLTEKQSIMLFPDASLLGGDIDQVALINRAKNYFIWAQTHPKVKALIPFMWQSYNDIIGLSQLSPATQYAYAELALAFKSNTPILSDPSSKTPSIISAGRGCSDNNCIWLIVKNIESDFRVDVRDITNSNLQSYYREAIDLTLHQSTGNYLVVFKIIQEPTIAELNTKGLKFWLVNPTSKTWTDPYLIQ